MPGEKTVFDKEAIDLTATYGTESDVEAFLGRNAVRTAEIAESIEGRLAALADKEPPSPVYQSLYQEAYKVDLPEPLSVNCRNIPIGLLRAVKGYTLAGYSPINDALRCQSAIDLCRLKPYIIAIAAGLNRLPVCQEIVFRGTDLPGAVFKSYQTALKNGSTVHDRAFLSTTNIRGEADGTVESGGFSSNHFLQIHPGKHGHDVSMIANDKSEGEVIFLPGTRFSVRKIDEEAVIGGKKRTLIEMSQVD